MSIETTLRSAFEDMADDAPPVPGLAAAALRRAHRRRTAARSAVAAGAVAAVAVPAALTVSARDDHRPAVASGAGTDIRPAPASRDLTDDELAATCDAGRPAGAAAERRELVHGIQVLEPPAPDAAATWVIGRLGDEERLECILDGNGELVPRSVLPVDADPDVVSVLDPTLSVGRFTDPVVRVTVQAPGEPERDAVLWEDYWFYPAEFRVPDGELVCVGSAEDDSIPGLLPLGYVLRGYDDDGAEVLRISSPECARSR